ncbi:MAG: IPT/TIG domain-containing protein [Polyangiaceae bacterium]
MVDEKAKNDVSDAPGTPGGPAQILADEIEYPPPHSVPRPPPPVSLRQYVAPSIDDVGPGHGPVLGDTKVTLTGKHLYRVSIVRFGGLIAQTVGADEPRELRVLAPPAERPGEVDITIENPFVPPVVLARAFRYEKLAPPAIESVAPERLATKGGELTISGRGFVKGATVLVDGKPAASVRVLSDVAIDVKAPPGEDGKMVDVTVKSPDGQSATARRAFVYDRRFG